MHRTRHSSLDYLGGSASSQEEWSEFLSTSMMALSTADFETFPPRLESPTRRHRGNPSDMSIGSRSTKPRGMSMTEAMASPPPPPLDAWRPLGRRVASSSPPPTLTHSSSSSPDSTSLSDNQVEHNGAMETHASVAPTMLDHVDNNSSYGTSVDGKETKLRHAASFRGVVSSCLSSSGSSVCDSLSSDEEPQEKGSQQLKEGAVSASAPSIDPSYAESCLPVLSQLPHPPRSISVDSGARPGTLSHVKSPVLGNRKDGKTWQLQDEEFFMTSPRFGTSLSNRDGRHVDLFRGNSGGPLLSTESGNQYDEEYQSHSRLSKDSRASSVDFTLGRSHDVSPPLPPPQEPLQRLRARSFSYSAVYGTSGYNPFNKQQYGPPPPHHQLLQQPQQTMAQEFPQTLRSFHSGSGMMQPGQPQPPPTGVRPPRVSIPTDSPMHQFQYGPPIPYRRYSDAFAMAPYPDSYTSEQQENQSRQSNTSREMRSYSMEYGNYSSTRQIRSQSMEGPQLFASAPPMEYPPSLSRSNSAGVNFDWARGHMDAAPPLPPDVRSVSSNGGVLFPPPPPEAFYDVEFKRGRQEVFAGRAAYKPGEYVKVEADRGEDIGRIVQRTTEVCKGGNESGSLGEESLGRGKRHDLPTKKIICVASQREFEMLNEQRKEESEVFEVCKSKVRQRLLPMNVIDAEYQFDRHKLTFFFEADRRIDFRELVRDLFAIYKTRIWLQQVIPLGKKTGNELDAN